MCVVPCVESFHFELCAALDVFVSSHTQTHAHFWMVNKHHYIFICFERHLSGCRHSWETV